MPEQFMNKTMRFDYGGEKYADGHERTFGKKMCVGEHNLESATLTDEEKTYPGACGAVICKRCNFRMVVSTMVFLNSPEETAKLRCDVCGFPKKMHSTDNTSVVIEGLGSVPCWPAEEKR